MNSTLKLLLRNWKENSRNKKKDLLKLETRIMTKMEGSITKTREQIGENPPKNLLNLLQGNKREM